MAKHKTGKVKRGKSALHSLKEGLQQRRQQQQQQAKGKGATGTSGQPSQPRHTKQAPKENPFEQRFTRLKHDVLGRDIRGTQGKPALARQRGIETVRASGWQAGVVG